MHVKWKEKAEEKGLLLIEKQKAKEKRLLLIEK